MKGFKLIIPPAIEPVSLQEAKSWLKVEINEDDALITELIKTARQMIETYTKRKLITQTWELYSDKISEKILEVPFSPLQAVESIKIILEDGSEQIVSAGSYLVDTSTGRIKFKEELEEYRDFASLIVRFSCGYGSLSTDVPEIFKTAIKKLVAYFYENREITEMPKEIERLLFPFRSVYL